MVRRGLLLGGPKDAKARKDCQKAMMPFRKVVFALTSQIKAQGRIIPRTKARESSKKEKARKKLILNLDFQLLKHLKKKHSHAWESDDWSNSQWPDDSWTPASSPKTHTAWRRYPL